MDPSPEEVAPLALVVIVAHEPGTWFESTLESLRDQDYPNVAVLVVDAASPTDQSSRIRRVLPDARITRLETNPGFGAAANAAILGQDEIGEAAFLLICHDDVALAPDAVRELVEEAYRSNVGVGGPKLVEWDEPDRLLQVGTSIDKTGVPAPYIEPGELDQQQQDAVRDVFAIPGGCTLTRADLFVALDGFDPGIDYLGEDIDFCWRAHIAGARVLVVPAARVRHRAALARRRPGDNQRRQEARHRLRSVLCCYSGAHLLRVLPQAFVIAVAEVLYAIVVGRGRHAADVANAWMWNLGHLGDIRARRKQIRAVRQVRDRDLRRLQARGSARFTASLRGQIGSGDHRIPVVTGASRQMVGSLREGDTQAAVAIWVGVLVVLLVGSRGLIFSDIPAIGQFAAFPDNAGDLLGEWTSGWRTAGLGGAAAQPTAYGALGILGYFFLGAMGVLRTTLIVAMLPLGALGMWRLLAPAGSRLARAVAVVTYVSIPVALNAMAYARWDGLVAYGLAPFILAALARATEAAPWGAIGGAAGRGVGRRTFVQRVLALGLLLAVASLLVPALLPLTIVVGLGLTVGSVLAGQPEGSIRAVGVAVGASLLALVLQFPWSGQLIDAGWVSVDGVRSDAAGPLTWAEILRFQIGPIGAAPLGWAFLVVGAFALLVGRDWRLAWAVRGWTVAMSCWGLLWLGQQGWLPGGLPAPSVVLAPAAVGLALAAGMGVAAFEIDLTGYRFGWRQVAGLVAGAALVVGAAPVVGEAIIDGRWDVPSRDYTRTLSILGDETGDAGYRMLWLGDPDVLPLSGWRLRDDLAYATTEDRAPLVQDLWAGAEPGATDLIRDALDEAVSGNTKRLGEELAPMGVRYLIVPLRLAPDSDLTAVPPEDVIAALDEQLDFVEEDLTSDLVVYRNESWVSTRIEAAADAEDGVNTGEPVLQPDGYASFSGPLADAGSVYYRASQSDGWRLDLDGADAKRADAPEWANRFDVDGEGKAVLHYQTGSGRRAILFVQLVLWICLAIVVLRHAVNRRANDEIVEPASEPASEPERPERPEEASR